MEPSCDGGCGRDDWSTGDDWSVGDSPATGFDRSVAWCRNGADGARPHAGFRVGGDVPDEPNRPVADDDRDLLHALGYSFLRADLRATCGHGLLSPTPSRKVAS